MPEYHNTTGEHAQETVRQFVLWYESVDMQLVCLDRPDICDNRRGVIIIMIIAMKSAIRDFYNLLTAPRTVCSAYAKRSRHNQILPCNISSSYRMSCATRCKGTAQLSSFTELKSQLFSFRLLTETDGGGEETGVPEKTPYDELQKMPHTKVRRFKPQPRLEPALWYWWQARKADAPALTPRVAHWN